MPAVNPLILEWARETSGLPLAEAAKKLLLHSNTTHTAEEKLRSFENGSEDPSRILLNKMAKVYFRPLLTFYLDKIPNPPPKVVDFRSIQDATVSVRETALFNTLIRRLQAKQQTIKDLIVSEDKPNKRAFVNSIEIKDGKVNAVAALRATLNLSLESYRKCRDIDAAFTLLRESVEDAGVFVLLASNLGSHHTTLSANVYRGATISDEFAPFILVNSNDSKAARSFTLLHEVVHLLLGHTCVSGGYANSSIEQFCNDVASEFLLPSAEIHSKKWSVDKTLNMSITSFAFSINASSSMVAYRLYRSNIITNQQFSALRETYATYWRLHKEKKKKEAREKDGGPNYYVVSKYRLGSALVEYVSRMFHSGELATNEAARVLGVKPRQIEPLIMNSN